LDRCSVVCKVRHGPLKEQLIERQLALEDVALREADDLLDVRSHEKLVRNHIVGEARREPVHGLQYDLFKARLLGAPVGILQLVGGVATEEIDNVFSRGSQ